LTYVIFGAEINLNQEANVSNMYLDPSGLHLILSFSPKDSRHPAEVFYIGSSNGHPKPKEIPQLKSHIVTAMAWNQEFVSENVAPFLLGTSKGLIFEAEIINNEIRNCKQVRSKKSRYSS